MAERPVSALDGRLQSLAEKARVAVEQSDTGYALAACAEILDAAPDCLAVRRLQRIARLQQCHGRKRWTAKTRGMLRWVRFGYGLRRFPPAQAFRVADDVLAADPVNLPALRMLAAAAQVLGWPETALFAWEILRELEPDNDRTLLALGQALFEQGRCAEALTLADDLLARQPAHPAAQDLMRRASIAETMVRGRWEAGGTFREKLKQAR